MTATQSQELADVVDRVKDWPLDMRISLARRILETAETPAIIEPSQDALTRPGDRHPRRRMPLPRPMRRANGSSRRNA